VGHGAENSLSPAFYYYFARLWTGGEGLLQSVGIANYQARALIEWFGDWPSRYSPLATIYGGRALWIGSPSAAEAL
jgi:hypothetical protein